jgi:cbb3-type cytochrome oxidase subunit 3
MKMYKYILESVNNVNWLAIIPLIIFFIFFVSMFIYVVRTKKSHLDKMSNLPLSNDL